jgi:hypothetical protein
MDETVWLSQKVMAELFQKDVRTINEHILRIFEEGELQPDSVIRNFRITAADYCTVASEEIERFAASSRKAERDILRFRA